jgi:GT2 family glycosyltransferase
MCVFNGERFLHDAVKSILSQSFEDFEFTVINDGSTDRSGEILESYRRQDSRLRVYHQTAQGVIASLTTACGVANGKYIARMDADDVAVRERLETQVAFMEAHPEVGLLGGAVEFINGSGQPLAICTNPVDDGEIRSALLERCAFWHPSVVMRKTVFFRAGGYRNIVIDAEDYDLWLRIAEHSQLANLQEVVLRYRLHPHQVSVRKCRQQALSALAARVAARSRRAGRPDPLTSLTEITPLVLEEIGVSAAAQEAAVAREYRRWIHNLCNAGEYPAALQMLREMFHSSDWKHAENWVIGDIRLVAAQVHWRQRHFGRCAVATGQALLTRPKLLGRPFMTLAGRLGLAAR